MSKPLIQIDDLVREMTDEEYFDAIYEQEKGLKEKTDEQED
jgi:hypothetical protein